MAFLLLLLLCFWFVLPVYRKRQQQPPPAKTFDEADESGAAAAAASGAGAAGTAQEPEIDVATKNDPEAVPIEVAIPVDKGVAGEVQHPSGTDQTDLEGAYFDVQQTNVGLDDLALQDGEPPSAPTATTATALIDESTTSSSTGNPAEGSIEQV